MEIECWTDERLRKLTKTVAQTTHKVEMLVDAVNAFIEQDRKRAEELQEYKREDNRWINLLYEDSQQYGQDSELNRQNNEQDEQGNDEHSE